MGDVILITIVLEFYEIEIILKFIWHNTLIKTPKIMLNIKNNKGFAFWNILENKIIQCDIYKNIGGPTVHVTTR